MHNNSDVCAIIVTYNPDMEELEGNINAIVDQVGAVCIVDNSTQIEKQKQLIKFERSNIKIIINKENLGIALAQNLGIKWAINSKYNYFFLLDQDSKAEPLTITNLKEQYHLLRSKGLKVACVGPVAFDRDKSDNSAYNQVTGDSNIVMVNETLSSGMLLEMSVLEKVGMLEEDLFIDLVDYEWCWRARELGYSTFITNNVKLPHRLGENRYQVLGVNVGIPAPVRHYYQYRNTINLIRRRYVPLKFKVKYVFYLPFKFFFYSFFAGQNLLRIKMMIKGILHALIGVKGKGLK
jgi:rhamnosyltransferase